MGIRQKVLLVLMSVLLVALSLSGWFALQQEKENIIQEVEHRGGDIARFVAKSLAFSVVGYDYHTIQLLLDEITRSEEISYARVTNQRKKEMGISGVFDKEKNINTSLFIEPIKLEDEVVGELSLGLSYEKVSERLEANKYTLITREAIILLMIAIGEFIALSYIIIRPVKLISASLAVCDEGRLISNIALDSDDEFGQLARKFNELGSQLNAANDKLQSKIEAADDKLKYTNIQLLKQQEELKNINDELRYISITDPLTGLYNRRHFEDLIKTEMKITERHGDKNSLIMIDIDHFKKINDKFGHFSGDAVLKLVATTLKEKLRETDVLCRIGGEEFVVLCKRVGKDEAKLVAEKLRVAMENAVVEVAGSEINITISLGCASIPDANTRTIDEFYRYADQALYYSKENGRNQFAHYDDLKPDDLKPDELKPSDLN